MHAHAVIYLFNRSQALQLALSVVRLPAAHYVTPSKPPAPVVHAAHAQGGCTCAVGSACACVYLRRHRLLMAATISCSSDVRWGAHGGGQRLHPHRAPLRSCTTAQSRLPQHPGAASPRPTAWQQASFARSSAVQQQQQQQRTRYTRPLAQLLAHQPTPQPRAACLALRSPSPRTT